MAGHKESNNKNDIQTIPDLENAIRDGKEDKVEKFLGKITEEQIEELKNYRTEENSSLLHLAAIYTPKREIIREIIKKCPDLMTLARESKDYRGQTPLHIAIAKGNKGAVEEMMLSADLSKILHKEATGDKFDNTVIMGGLPLSVAALTFNEDMIKLLLKYGAVMKKRNSKKGDTVFHSLIRFAATNPEDEEKVLKIMKFLHNTYKVKAKAQAAKDLWFKSNNDDLTPMQLSASLSRHAIFEFILQLRDVYCIFDSHDGLFDKELYDITEIDTIATERWARQRRMGDEDVSQKKLNNCITTTCYEKYVLFKREKKKSVLETMFDIRSSAAFEFIQQPVLRDVIKTKWLRYRRYYYPWAVFHILFMVGLTVYSVYKADGYVLINVYSILYLIIALGLLLMMIYHITLRVKSYNVTELFNVLHNGQYRIVLTIFSLSLILEFILTRTLTSYGNYCLIAALISGWWFTVFFLRAWKKFSFFTVMIQKIIFGDLLRFSLLIFIMLVAFTAAVLMTFKGSQTTDDDLLSYRRTMMLMFKLMLGLGDIEALYEARQPWMAVTLFIVFVILTYVLMFNALIAMMSETCAQLSQDRFVQWRVQQLSIILFFESILPNKYSYCAGETIPNIETRYFIDISSLKTEDTNEETNRFVASCAKRWKNKVKPEEDIGLPATTDGVDVTDPAYNGAIRSHHCVIPKFQAVKQNSAGVTVNEDSYICLCRDHH